MPRTLAGASIDLLPHQFIASLALVRGIASRVCVMDEVGTGKTIQAGIAIAELIARGMAARVLVIVPAHLRQQWAAELGRVGIASRVLDAHGRDEARNALPPDVSPWTLPGTIIASLDLVKRRDTLVGLEDAHWDLVVVDEAHGATSNSDRHDAVDGLARRADRVIVLTATPHDGDDLRYRRLLSLGGSDAVVAVRHSRPQLPRRAHTLAIRPSADEQAAFAMLDRYRTAIDRLAATARGGVNRLVAEVLVRRAASSMFALARTAARRREALQQPDATQPLLFAACLAMLDIDGDDDAAIDAVMKAPGALSVSHERALLGAIHGAALRASADDSLVNALARIVRRAREPVIVFVEYRDALVPIARRLSRVASIEVLHGGCSATDRAHALSSFTTGRAQALLTTDTAAEGLNLHHRCRFVVHLDTPWTPTRRAQREGRVDRHGQGRRVHAWRLERMGHEQVALRVRQQDRSRAIDEALAPHGDVPVLVTANGVTLLPALRREAEQACDLIRHLRASACTVTRPRCLPEHGTPVCRTQAADRTRALPVAACAGASRPFSMLRPRTRLVAIRRAALPAALSDASALAVLTLVVSASPAVSIAHQVVVTVGPMPGTPARGRLQRTWRRRLAVLRPWLETHARAAVHEIASTLAADETRRQRGLDDRARLVDEARQTPLATHFVQRELFATTPCAAPVRPRMNAVRPLCGPSSGEVLVDVSLLLVPAATPSTPYEHAIASLR